ncbi:C39 family peptidase [Shewanella sp. Isolate13]|uniref:C39 family peptidase n=1 Tax=Shewanella sp. Isolate13 TaxID=2908531 RepID=UPI001EFD60A0|nr:C39 family peptidase [Shewanella sp. Isolate13]MCG9729595.1 C39 family peptidase [Shewanella sp. Isolate13]
MKAPFFVSTFDKQQDNFAFSNLIKQTVNVQLEDVTLKKQLDSIKKILCDLNAKTMVCENQYTDNGYLDDYLNYYVGCHENYPKNCSRIHFFDQDFDYDTFERVVASPSQDPQSLGGYLGFMVVKPIPMTFIGRTCLKLPESFTAPESTVITREYTADLFGLKLTVSSLAFQEQDRVVAACSSSSIWCLMHALKLRRIKSPAQITLAATESSKIINTFPSTGLNAEEIERALEYFDLRQHQISPKGSSKENLPLLKEVVQTYIDSNIPLILGLECQTKQLSKPYETAGEHAVTIIGYGKNESGEMDKLIVHDDRNGPFSILKFVSDYTVKNAGEKVTVLISEEFYANSENVEAHECPEVMVYNNLIIATDPRVRIGFDPIALTTVRIRSFLNSVFKVLADSSSESASKVSTRLKLLKSTEYKQIVKNSGVINKTEILTRSFPKFLWISEVSLDGQPHFDLIFDSTNLPQGEAYLCSALYDETATETLDFLSKEYNETLANRSLYTAHDPDFINQVLKTIKAKTKPNRFFNYLDEVFGRAWMPQLIKNTEIANRQLNEQNSKLVLQHSFDNRDETTSDRFKALLDKQEVRTYEWKKSEPKEEIQTRWLIWVISEYGALFIGEDSAETGHPTLTGARPARIGGEFIQKPEAPNTIYVNCFSGRYSKNFADTPEKDIFLKNAMTKISDILGGNGYTFVLDERLNTK